MSHACYSSAHVLSVLPVVLLQRQRAALTWAPALSAESRVFRFSNLLLAEGRWEARVFELLPELGQMQAAVQELVGGAAPPDAVNLHKYMGLPRQGHAPLVDTIHPHRCVFDRQRNRLALDHVAYRRTWQQDGSEVEEVHYAQVVAMGTVAGHEFVFCRGYTTLPQRHPVLLLQQLEWEKPHRAGGAKKRAATVQGAFFAVSPAALVHQVCVVPDYKLTCPAKGIERFLVNLWVLDAIHTKE